MLRIKQHRFIWVAIIVLGVILLGMPTVYASDQYVVDEVEPDDSENGIPDVVGEVERDDCENYIPVYSTRRTETIFGGTFYAVNSPSCTKYGTIYRATGGGCSLQFAGVRNGLEASRPTPNLDFALPTGWECRGWNFSSRTIHVTAHVICTLIC
ncbi:hypothetical protein LCGC14_1862320 [marine sediment metagenome]|uniref:Uncharacterized protein n=1 Tax=marine sediment metagenome TaxID=412755 RepID=A0A0F9G757_9ZZZZ